MSLEKTLVSDLGTDSADSGFLQRTCNSPTSPDSNTFATH